MDYNDDSYRISWWERNLEDIDREAGRMALLCRVQIFAPGVIDRIIQKDATVCGVDHPVAFRKLHELMVMHFLNRQKAADELGQTCTTSIEFYIIERLRRSFPNLATDLPPR